MKTAGVKKLVNAALDQVPKPYTDDVIDDVFMAIESELELRTEYDALVQELGKSAVNAWGGYWISNAVGKTGLHQIRSRRSKLIPSYSQLTAAATASSKKRKEPEALQLMSDYYQANKTRFSPSIRNHRELIVEMIIEGLPVEEVFAMVPLDDVEPPGPGQRRR